MVLVLHFDHVSSVPVRVTSQDHVRRYWVKCGDLLRVGASTGCRYTRCNWTIRRYYSQVLIWKVRSVTHRVMRSLMQAIRRMVMQTVPKSAHTATSIHKLYILNTGLIFQTISLARTLR